MMTEEFHELYNVHLEVVVGSLQKNSCEQVSDQDGRSGVSKNSFLGCELTIITIPQ